MNHDYRLLGGLCFGQQQQQWGNGLYKAMLGQMGASFETSSTLSSVIYNSRPESPRYKVIYDSPRRCPNADWLDQRINEMCVAL